MNRESINHKQRLEEIRQQYREAREKGRTGYMKFLETLEKLHKKEQITA